MTDNTRAYGLNRTERPRKPAPAATAIYPGQVPTGTDGSAERAAANAPRGEQYAHADRMANATPITVRTRVDVVPGERTPSGEPWTPTAKRANWRDYSGR